MSKQSSPSGLSAADVLDAHLAVFVARLAKAGYEKETRRGKERLILPFIRWVRETGIGVTDVDEACVDAFLACPSRRRYNHRTALRQFIEHVRIAGVAPPRRLQPSLAELLVQRYRTHLRDSKGLSSHSIDVYSPFVRAFVVAQQLPENAGAVDAGAGIGRMNGLFAPLPPMTRPRVPTDGPLLFRRSPVYGRTASGTAKSLSLRKMKSCSPDC